MIEIKVSSVKGDIKYEKHPICDAYDTLQGFFPGSVHKCFYSDPIFSQFQNVDHSYTGIERGIEIARRAVLAYYDQGVRDKYLECQSVGGHIHSAKITYQGGFEWIAPPLPKTLRDQPS